jgi:hypothetical protein
MPLTLDRRKLGHWTLLAHKIRQEHAVALAKAA